MIIHKGRSWTEDNRYRQTQFIWFSVRWEDENLSTRVWTTAAYVSKGFSHHKRRQTWPEHDLVIISMGHPYSLPPPSDNAAV